MENLLFNAFKGFFSNLDKTNKDFFIINSKIIYYNNSYNIDEQRFKNEIYYYKFYFEEKFKSLDLNSFFPIYFCVRELDESKILIKDLYDMYVKEIGLNYTYSYLIYLYSYNYIFKEIIKNKDLDKKEYLKSLLEYVKNLKNEEDKKENQISFEKAKIKFINDLIKVDFNMYNGEDVFFIGLKNFKEEKANCNISKALLATLNQYEIKDISYRDSNDEFFINFYKYFYKIRIKKINPTKIDTKIDIKKIKNSKINDEFVDSILNKVLILDIKKENKLNVYLKAKTGYYKFRFKI
ncbi:MAG: hypothetical protein N4A54_09740 [Peptostreptococcaceae bacterium]|jgi:hypothetical protein|nr:hypothetical protein [Peptostreptococcaceae bacterium]